MALNLTKAQTRMCPAAPLAGHSLPGLALCPKAAKQHRTSPFLLVRTSR